MRVTLLSAVILLAVSSLEAGFVMTVVQEPSGVVASGYGNMDLTGLTYQTTVPVGTEIDPQNGVIIAGTPLLSWVDIYSGFTGPTSFGRGSGGYSGAGANGLIGISGRADLLFVPAGFVSGSFVQGDSFFYGSLASIGIAPGTYVWRWGSEPNQNFTLNVEAAKIPESSATLTLLFLSLAPLLVLSLTRSRANAA
ncbi:MAG: hypothetical protein JO354_00310 [Verrucomicrobia bacterium]|nr:hypothetical protein [Verrucomicrobiota bacterium]